MNIIIPKRIITSDVGTKDTLKNNSTKLECTLVLCVFCPYKTFWHKKNTRIHQSSSSQCENFHSIHIYIWDNLLETKHINLMVAGEESRGITKPE